MTFKQIQRQEKVKKNTHLTIFPVWLIQSNTSSKYFHVDSDGQKSNCYISPSMMIFYTVYIKQHASLQVHIFGGGVSNKVFCVNASADVWPNVKKLCEPDWCPLWDWIRGLWLWTPCPRLSEHRGPQANHHCTAPITRAAAVIIGFFLHFDCVQT